MTKIQCDVSGIEFESKQSSHLEGMKYCLELIEELRQEYIKCGYIDDGISVNRILYDVENKIGERCFKDWQPK